ncbi:LytR family response regulator receiver [gamma proteobacterium HdN1]|nr:LytR family response regulator receiver [gamma proteobacterium HdN1]
MRILICDDEPLARERLKRLLAEIPEANYVGEAENGIDLLEKAARLRPDVVISDIRMPVMDGLEAAEQLAKLPEAPALIFCTAYDAYAIRAFQVNAVGYLLKPVRQQDLAQALAQAQRLTRAQLQSLRESAAATVTATASGAMAAPSDTRSARKYIHARTHRGLELIRVDEIRCFVADQKYVTLFHGEGSVLIDETLKDLESEFAERFQRIHRNCLIQMDYLESLEQVGGQIYAQLRGLNMPLLVSRRLLPVLRKTLKNH